MSGRDPPQSPKFTKAALRLVDGGLPDGPDGMLLPGDSILESSPTWDERTPDQQQALRRELKKQRDYDPFK